MISSQQNIIILIKRMLIILLYGAIISEMFFFPSWANFCGCVMAFICCKVFVLFFLKREIILRYPFAFMMFLSMFLYRYLPLIATIVEGKPITYGLELPYKTFLLETILFMVFCLAFHFSMYGSKNNVLQKILYKIGFFDRYSSLTIWCLGLVGLFARLHLYSVDDIEYGDVTNKFMEGLIYLMYVPIVLLYPSLLGFIQYDDRSVIDKRVKPNPIRNSILKKRMQRQCLSVSQFKLHSSALVEKKILFYVYIVFIFTINVATNSREAIITPIAIIFLLFFLRMVKKNVIRRVSPLRLLVSIVVVVVVYNVLNLFSEAMLSTRSQRSNVTKSELIKNTFQFVQKENDKRKSYNSVAENHKVMKTYKQGWDETYIDNFMLNRYANIRITDETLYHAQHVQQRDCQSLMIIDFMNRIYMLLPTPVLQWLNISIDKSNNSFSRGDRLYSISVNKPVFAGFRVTSHLGDGLATFGYWYFPIQFILFWCVFKLLNSLVYYMKYGVVYSVYGLGCLFTFLGMFRNANGCIGEVGFCLRGFWQNLLIFIFLSIVLEKCCHFVLYITKKI